jgi:hypothetical protein
MRHLKSLRHLIWIAALGVAIGLFERHQSSTYGRLASRENVRVNPLLNPDGYTRHQLEGESLRELSAVLFELFPEEAAPNVMMGKTLVDQGKLYEARSHLERSLEIDRRSEVQLFLYARLLVDLDEDPQQIRAVVDELRRNYPRSRKKVEEYFERTSKGEINFGD